MTQHTNFSTRLDDLQKRVATARSAVQTAATESDAQLKERIDQATHDAVEHGCPVQSSTRHIDGLWGAL